MSQIDFGRTINLPMGYPHRSSPARPTPTGATNATAITPVVTRDRVALYSALKRKQQRPEYFLRILHQALGRHSVRVAQGVREPRRPRLQTALIVPRRRPGSSCGEPCWGARRVGVAEGRARGAQRRRLGTHRCRSVRKRPRTHPAYTPDATKPAVLRQAGFGVWLRGQDLNL